MSKLLSTLILVGVLGVGRLSPLDDTSDSDSSEHGVVETDVSNNCSCGWANKDDQRIVGGRPTKVNEYPLMAGLVFYPENSIVAGGTILTPRHILTAAHCVLPFKVTDFGIFVGHHNYEEVKTNHKLLEIEKFYIHEKYNKRLWKNDIAIILMKIPLQFNQNVGPSCLPTSRIPLEGKILKVLGWGRIAYVGPHPEVLRKVNLEVQPFKKCMQVHGMAEKNHQICTYTKDKDSCIGDSGGPLLWRDPDTNRYTVVGIVSYSTNCDKYPAVNTDVAYFLPWIQKTISKSGPCLKTCAKVGG